MTKVCSKCKLPKEVTEFGNNKTSKDKLNSQCKECSYARELIWRSKNQDRYKQKQKEHYEKNKSSIIARQKKRFQTKKQEITDHRSRYYSKIENRVKLWINSAKTRATKNNWNFNIDQQFLINLWEEQKGLCAITSFPMSLSQGNKRKRHSASLDRINPFDGYVKGNVRFVCDIVNIMRSSMTDPEFYKWCSRVTDGIRNTTHIVVPNLDSFADGIDRLIVELLKLSHYEMAKREEHGRDNPNPELVALYDNLSRDCCEYRSALKNFINEQLHHIVTTGSYLPLKEVRTFRPPKKSAADLVEEMVLNHVNLKEKQQLVENLQQTLSRIEHTEVSSDSSSD